MFSTAILTQGPLEPYAHSGRSHAFHADSDGVLLGIQREYRAGLRGGIGRSKYLRKVREVEHGTFFDCVCQVRRMRNAGCSSDRSLPIASCVPSLFSAGGMSRTPFFRLALLNLFNNACGPACHYAAATTDIKMRLSLSFRRPRCWRCAGRAMRGRTPARPPEAPAAQAPACSCSCGMAPTPCRCTPGDARQQCRCSACNLLLSYALPRHSDLGLWSCLCGQCCFMLVTAYWKGMGTLQCPL